MYGMWPQADLWVTQRFLEVVKRERGNGNIPKIKAFINRADTHSLAHENGEILAALGSLNVINAQPTMMMLRMEFRRSFSEGLALFESEPDCKAVIELDALAEEVYG